MQDERKTDMMKNAAYEQRTRKEQVHERLQKKLAKKNMENKMQSVAKKSMKNMLPTDKEKDLKIQGKELKSKEKLGNCEKDRLRKNDVELHNQTENVKQIDNKLDRIKSLYQKLQDKTSKANASN